MGALATGVVLVVIVATKFLHGAWVVLLLIPLFVWMFHTIKRHYLAVAEQLTLEGLEPEKWTNLPTRRHRKIVVPVSGMHRGTLAALQFARSLSKDVTGAIRAGDVTAASSIMSSVPEVRRALVARQREIGEAGDCVMEGRDIGTVVFPDADLKVFLTASLSERARRRFEQSLEQGFGALSEGAIDRERELERHAREIAERDERDATRTDSPLRKAGDAVEIDTTSLTIDEQIDRVVQLAIERGAKSRAGGGAEDR